MTPKEMVNKLREIADQIEKGFERPSPECEKCHSKNTTKGVVSHQMVDVRCKDCGYVMMWHIGDLP